MKPSRTPLRGLVLVFSIMLASGAAFVAQADAAASTTLSQAEQARQQLNLDLLAASASGYTEQDVSPILLRRQELIAAPAPAAITDRAAFYRVETHELTSLRAALASLEAHQLDMLARASASKLDALQEELTQSEKSGVDPGDLSPLREQAGTLRQTLADARTPAEFRRTYAALGAPIDAAQQLRASRLSDLATAQPEVDRLRQMAAANLAQVRWLGQQALGEARNYAAYEAYLRLPTGRSYELLETNARHFTSGDPSELAVAVALEEVYRDQLHKDLRSRLPHKVILVSIAASELWSYTDGAPFVNTLVTTGRPELPTDRGLMRIARKESPVHFISPFPKGSPYDYGTIDAKYALFFQPSGEAIHDSWWRSWYGPGSNIGDHGSHGCIGLPYGAIDSIYRWGEVGTPVVVIPGDGSPVANQLAQKSYDDPAWGTGPVS
ncbi:MAG: L,D-transpeptidase [Candidatus Dormibacteraeota bacterium]|nr:L,D-transpeptidase [Candidatus Dormibacteraeota bacterium]